MIPFLAQIPDAQALKDWLVVAAFLASIIANIVLVAQRSKTQKREIGPSPLLVQEQETYATRKQIDEAHGRMSRERKEIDLLIAQLREEDTRLRQKLEEEIKDLRQIVDEIPEKTIDLLRKTKGLIV
jgi:flagellar biosynthesis/type III secretory pathway M-ring protein FliF/YscJ